MFKGSWDLGRGCGVDERRSSGLITWDLLELKGCVEDYVQP